MFFGFPAAMMTQRLFVVKLVLVVVVYVSPELFKLLVHLMSADMKTSHGEPAAICCSSVLDEPELTTMLQLYCLSNAWVMLAMTLVRLDATKTVRVVGGGLLLVQGLE